MVELCKNERIEFSIVISPATKYYLGNFNINYKTYFYSAITDLEMKVIDLFADNRFDNGDFFDFDHLALTGARKLTEILEI